MNKDEEKSKLTCGVIMPISSIDGCSEQHWLDVKEILFDAINMADFNSDLVCDSDEVGIIQKKIIQNIYDNPIVVCDVSGKNPNVMFELGMRLAFDKPTIIVKDDHTSYSFDTSPIEHLDYPRDLRYSKIIAFKEKLASKLQATYKKATEDPNYTTFLKNFGTFTVAKLEKKEVSKEEFILEELQELKRLFNKFQIQNGTLQINRTSTMEFEYLLEAFITKYIEEKFSKQEPVDFEELKKIIFNDDILRHKAVNLGLNSFLVEKVAEKIFNKIFVNLEKNVSRFAQAK